MTSDQTSVMSGFRHVEPNGMAAALMLAFLATAGLFYVNLGGAFLSAFVDGLGISRSDAGYITSANKYGAAFGALLATLGARYLNWRKAAYVILPTLIVIDLASFQLVTADVLIGVRFMHGTVGGFLVGIGLAVIARTASPDKGYGMLLVVQYGFGSLGIFTVPKLVGTFGHGAAFGALILFSLLTLLMVPFIPDYAPKEKTPVHEAKDERNMVLPLVLVLMAIFLFQSSNMGVADYMFEIGKDVGYSSEHMSNILALAGIIAMLGAVLVYVIGTEYGRLLPVMTGLAVAAGLTFAFHWSEYEWLYFLANSVTGVTWSFCIAYLLGLAASFDGHGQTAALSGFVSKMGLASGPAIAATVVGAGNFTLIINLATVGLILCAVVLVWPARLVDSLTTDNLKMANRKEE